MCVQVTIIGEYDIAIYCLAKHICNPDGNPVISTILQAAGDGKFTLGRIRCKGEAVRCINTCKPVNPHIDFYSSAEGSVWIGAWVAAGHCAVHYLPVHQCAGNKYLMRGARYRK